LLVEEATLAVSVKDAEIFVILGARHTAGAAVVKREQTTDRARRFGFHDET